MASGPRPRFIATHRFPLLVSAFGHVLVLVLLFSASVIVIPRQPAPQLAIQAMVVDEGALRRAAEAEQRAAAAELQAREAQQRREAEQRQAQEAAARRERELAQQRQAEARRRAEAESQQRAEAEQRRQAEAEQRRLAEAEADRRRQAEAEAQRKAEQAAAEQRRREEEAQAKREQEKRAAEERARAEAAARRDQERREAELATAMAAEEALFSAQQSGELNRYLMLIQQKVERNWVRPPSALAGLECEVAVVQLPNGDVMDARTVRCNGDEAVRRSVENAVRRSSPLPLPDNRALFERNLRFVFKPEE